MSSVKDSFLNGLSFYSFVGGVGPGDQVFWKPNLIILWVLISPDVTFPILVSLLEVSHVCLAWLSLIN